ncbi:MAG TPA: translocation/assembly module TamB domain-containing protein [Polyangiaceae bacterium]|jgi:translocation and assembly module TamB
MAQGRLLLVVPVRNRDFGRALARALCVVLAVVGALPLLAGFVLSSGPVERWAARETRRILNEQLGLSASYRVELKLLPLRVALVDLVVQSSDGGAPALRVERVTVTPRVFSLLSGRFDAGDVEVDKPHARLSIVDGKLANLNYRLPETRSKQRAPSKQAPFGTLSVSEGYFSLNVDGTRIETGATDLDVFADSGPSFEIALRVGPSELARERVVRSVPPPPPGTTAFDEDSLCKLELRMHYEPGQVLVRRLEALGAVDRDAAAGPRPSCEVAKQDPANAVLLRLSEVRVDLSNKTAPRGSGHVLARAPLSVTNRFVRMHELRGWAEYDGDARYDGHSRLPELHGQIRGQGIEFERYKLAKTLAVDLSVAGDVIDIPTYQMTFADGDVELKNAHIEPFAPGIVLRAERVNSKGMQFEGLMRDLGVTPDTLIKWDLHDTRVSKIAGTISPLKIDAEIYADTKNFEVFDRAFHDPERKHMIGVRSALVRGHIGVRPDSFDIYDTRTDFGQSSLNVKLVSIGFSNQIAMSVSKGSRLNFADISPLIDIPIAGKAEIDAEMGGLAKNPLLTGNLKVQGFELGGFPFGDILSSKLKFRPLVLELADVQAKKGQSDYTVTSGRLDFDGNATLITDAHVKSSNLDFRDFFAMWHFDTDPRFDDVRGETAVDATVRYVLGGPEDRCRGGNLRVAGSAHIAALDLFDERYDSGETEFDFRWTDRDAAYRGVDLNVPSLTLRKGSGVLMGSLGMRQGARVYGQLVGTAVPLSRIDGLPTILRAADGQINAVAELGGTIDALQVNTSGNISPIHLGRATLPASRFDIHLEPASQEQKVSGTSHCGQPISPPFERADFEADRSAGSFRVNADLFGGQIKLTDLRISRQRSKVVSGVVEARSADLGAVAELVPALARSDTHVAGKLSARLSLTEMHLKEPVNASASLALTSCTLDAKGYHLELAPGTNPIMLDHGRLDAPMLAFSTAMPHGQKATFDASGSITKLGDDPAIDAKLTLRPVPLSGLVSLLPRAERADGMLSGHVALEGPLSAPRLSGGFDLEHGELSLHGLPVPVSEIELALRLDGNEIRLTRGTAHVGAGTLQVTGGAPLHGSQLGAARFAVTARNVALPMNDGIRAVADADLQITTQPQNDDGERTLPKISGDVTLRSVEYKRAVTMAADISTLAQRGKRTQVETYDPADDVVDFDLRLLAPRPMRLQNNLIDAELSVADEGLQLSGTNARFGLRGALTLKPGGKIFLRRSEFEVTQGQVRFDDVTRVAAQVDVTAVTEYRRYQTNTSASAPAPSSSSASASGGSGFSPTAQGGRWRIQMHAHGDADNLRVDLTSDPALQQDDIFLLLTVGLTRAELDQAQSASVGESVALEALGSLSGADRAVTDAVPLIDEFRFGSAYSSVTGRTEPTVTIGKRLTERLRANVTSGVADSREVRSNVEWRLNPRVSVEGSYDNVNDISSSSLGNLGADIRWRLEFQ